MSQNEISIKVIDIIANQLSLADEDVRPSLRLMDDLGADSLDLVELVMEFEEEFDIEIPDDDLESILTVQDVIDYVSAHVAK